MAEKIPLIYNASANQIQEVAISDELSVGILTAAVFSNMSIIETPLTLTNTSHNYFHVGPVAVSGIGTISVGAGVSYTVL